MKNKIAYILILAVTTATAFLIGEYKGKSYSKYDYLNLNEITCTEISGQRITIHTLDGDEYLIFGAINRWLEK